MASTTIYTSAVEWGASSFSNTGDLKVGRTSDDKYYKGRITFPEVSADWTISKITLK